MASGIPATPLEHKYYWYQYDDIGFPQRVNHAAAAHVDDKSRGAYVFSFGGYHADKETRAQPDYYRNHVFKSADIDIHKFDVATRQWSLVKTRSKKDDPLLAPCAKCRYGHSVCSYNGRAYMFGGRNDDDGSMSCVACFDIASSSWIVCDTSGQVPAARDGHGCTVIGSVMFIHGGYCEMESQFTNTLYGLNLETLMWTEYPDKGARVVERDFHTATAVGQNKIIVFGGRSDELAPIFSARDIYDDKFYCYDLNKLVWSEMITTGYKPVGRRSHCAVCCTGNIVYFAGFNNKMKKHFADLFILNTATNHITEVRPWGEYPCARRRSACALVGTEIIIFGGTSPQPVGHKGRELLVDRSDTYILNILPSLQELCVSCIVEHGVNYAVLPSLLIAYIEKIRSLDSKRSETDLK
ncbi:kelch domain-containing protein 3-like isoform X1 [Dysidea avara]|uniref:kelch domain-containing protein 3-like isoform X1 n=1 Tax=Dysidea avara TaxID=196820 RepID=UPI0033174371